MNFIKAPWSLLHSLVSNYIDKETNSEVGKVNLIALAFMTVAFLVAIPPSLLIAALRIFSPNPPPEWIWAIPITGFFALAGIAGYSFSLIPKEPPQ